MAQWTVADRLQLRGQPRIFTAFPLAPGQRLRAPSLAGTSREFEDLATGRGRVNAGVLPDFGRFSAWSALFGAAVTNPYRIIATLLS